MISRTFRVTADQQGNLLSAPAEFTEASKPPTYQVHFHTEPRCARLSSAALAQTTFSVGSAQTMNVIYKIFQTCLKFVFFIPNLCNRDDTNRVAFSAPPHGASMAQGAGTGPGKAIETIRGEAIRPTAPIT